MAPLRRTRCDGGGGRGMRGQRERDLGARSRLALRPDAPAMGLDDAAGNVQPESQPALAIFPVCLGKPLKDGIKATLGDAGAGINDGQAVFGTLGLTIIYYFPAFRREPERILDEVG